VPLPYLNGRIAMPKVGGKHFSYSKAGKQAAKRYAAKTGQKLAKAKPQRKTSRKK